MQTLNSFANHVGGLTTQAVKACTHRFHSLTLGSTCGEVSPNPTKFLISNPSLLSTRRGYPHSGSAARVNNSQAPLSFQVKHIAVSNQLSSKGIYNFNHISSQYEFGFYPKKENKNAENCADKQVTDDLKIVFNDPETVDGEKSNQYIRSSRPSKVATRPKGFIHHLIIAGEGK